MATTNFLGDSVQRDMEPDIMDHTKSVADEYYNKGGIAQKVNFIISKL